MKRRTLLAISLIVTSFSFCATAMAGPKTGRPLLIVAEDVEGEAIAATSGSSKIFLQRHKANGRVLYGTARTRLNLKMFKKVNAKRR